MIAKIDKTKSKHEFNNSLEIETKQNKKQKKTKQNTKTNKQKTDIKA